MPTDATTVGTRVRLEHRAPTPVGRTVVAHAELTSVDGNRLVFSVTVTEGDTVVAQGTVERVLVDRHLFVERAFRS
jgi:predicted thioesterase